MISEICCTSNFADILGKRFLPNVVAGANMYEKLLANETIRFDTPQLMSFYIYHYHKLIFL